MHKIKKNEENKQKSRYKSREIYYPLQFHYHNTNNKKTHNLHM